MYLLQINIRQLYDEINKLHTPDSENQGSLIEKNLYGEEEKRIEKCHIFTFTKENDHLKYINVERPMKMFTQ
ncbi:hypothetical protein T02_928 [Trichinella nativa]|uniref:Uncharacterized protein n=1 Tax=Trichinella nativa TaxID=6335 RepID=A0A0V1KM70_9BILA|nr:hypothetical protein T02_928 [Trichinella nativa]